MKMVKSGVLAAAAVLAVSAPAWCQGSTAPGPADQHGYVSGLAGAVSGPPSTGTVAVEYAENMRPDTVAYVTVAYFNNLLRSDVRNDLAAAGAQLTAITGTPFVFSGRDEGVAFLGGAKYVLPFTWVQPYIGGGAGAIRLNRTITEAHLGDVKQAVLNDFGIGGFQLLDGVTKPIGEVAAGVSFALGHTYVDVAYRFRKVYQLDNTLDFSQFSGGIGYRF